MIKCIDKNNLKKDKIIARDLFLQLDKIIEMNESTNNSFLTGKLGLALYYFSLYEVFKKNKDGQKCTKLIESVIVDFNNSTRDIYGNSFGSGVAGIGYIITLFNKHGLIEIDLHDELKEMDNSLYKSALIQINKYDAIDFLHGAMGIIHYFTKRLPDPLLSKYILSLTNALCLRAVKEKRGVWFKNYILLEKEKDEINFSLAHGLSGFLLLLIYAQDKLPSQPFLTGTISQGIDFIWSQYSEKNVLENRKSFFPSSISCIHRENKYFTSRLAWCYGDLNMLLAISEAARLLKKPEWIYKVDILGYETLLRSELSEVVATDSHFCHGTAGLAQVYKRLYEIRHKKFYKTAWEYWVHQTLCLIPNELEKEFYKGKECNILGGMLGVNLVLLSFISDKQLSWSKSLLL